MLRKVEYIIEIPPIPWKRAGVNEKHFFDRQSQEKLFYGLTLSKLHGANPMFAGPVQVNLIFYMPIPKSTKRRQASDWHFKRPDIDNLCKFFFDAATGVLWEDDSIICSSHTEKHYSKQPRTHITIWELE